MGFAPCAEEVALTAIAEALHIDPHMEPLATLAIDVRPLGGHEKMNADD